MMNGTEIDPREEKLPVWVKSKLATMRMRLHEAHKSLDEKIGTGPRENAHVLPLQSYVDFVPTQHRLVRFFTGPGDRDWIDLCNDQHGPGLRCSSHNLLAIRPSSSNVAFLSAEHWR